MTTHVDDLHRLVRRGVAVDALVLARNCRRERRASSARHLSSGRAPSARSSGRRSACRSPRQSPPRGGDALAVEPGGACARAPRTPARARPPQASSSATRVRTRSRRRGATSSPSAQRMPGRRRDQDPLDAEIARQRRRRAAGPRRRSHEGVAARIVALAHRDDADGAEHVGLHDRDDAARRLDAPRRRAGRPARRSPARPARGGRPCGRRGAASR